MNNYGMTKQQMLKGPTDCFDNNGKKHLTNPFNQGLPLDAKAECVFNLLVCDRDISTEWEAMGIVDFCRQKRGLDA